MKDFYLPHMTIDTLIEQTAAIDVVGTVNSAVQNIL